jgi:hypothetical protein
VYPKKDNKVDARKTKQKKGKEIKSHTDANPNPTEEFTIILVY